MFFFIAIMHSFPPERKESLLGQNNVKISQTEGNENYVYQDICNLMFINIEHILAERYVIMFRA